MCSGLHSDNYLTDLIHRREVIGNRSMKSSHDNGLEEPRLYSLMCIKRSFECSASPEKNALSRCPENENMFQNLKEK